MPALLRPLVAAALVLGAIVLWAPPASAHAILLRTEPAPQTTVDTPPDTVRLFFSEPVEAIFGAVRVFDVDGNRVDSGAIRRVNGNRQVELPVELENGTYTVTWRVTGADGHPVRGGFGFFVGSPSTISAVAVPTDSASSAIVSWGYGASRFAWFAALLAIVGMVAVRRWVWTPAVRTTGLGDSAAAAGFVRRFRRALPGAWGVLLVAGVLVLIFQAATVSGLPALSAARPSVLRELLHTVFGRLWLVQMGLALAIGLPVLALVARRPLLGVGPRTWMLVLGVLSAGLCVATAVNGHARTVGGAGIIVPSLAVHLLAVAVWAGGLGALVVLGRLAWREVAEADRPALLRQLVANFGRLALVGVAVVVVTGTITAIGLFGALSDLWRVSFGQIVAAKVVLLAVALVLAARHRWRVPRLLGAADSAPGGVASFERSGPVELVVLAVAVALAAALLSLVPGRSLALAAKGPVNLERALGPYTVQLYIDPTMVGENEVHVTFVNDRGLAAAEVANTAVSLGVTDAPPAPVAMRLISPGHFVGDVSFPSPNRYQVVVTMAAVAGSTATFDFRLHN